MGHEDWVHSVQWQPANTKNHTKQALCLLSTSMDRTMMLWRPDAATGRYPVPCHCVPCLTPHSGMMLMTSLMPSFLTLCHPLSPFLTCSAVPVDHAVVHTTFRIVLITFRVMVSTLDVHAWNCCILASILSIFIAIVYVNSGFRVPVPPARLLPKTDCGTNIIEHKAYFWSQPNIIQDVNCS